MIKVLRAHLYPPVHSTVCTCFFCSKFAEKTELFSTSISVKQNQFGCSVPSLQVSMVCITPPPIRLLHPTPLKLLNTMIVEIIPGLNNDDSDCLLNLCCLLSVVNFLTDLTEGIGPIYLESLRSLTLHSLLPFIYIISKNFFISQLLLMT